MDRSEFLESCRECTHCHKDIEGRITIAWAKCDQFGDLYYPDDRPSCGKIADNIEELRVSAWKKHAGEAGFTGDPVTAEIENHRHDPIEKCFRFQRVVYGC